LLIHALASTNEDEASLFATAIQQVFSLFYGMSPNAERARLWADPHRFRIVPAGWRGDAQAKRAAGGV
jgi:hypothetical protein